MDGSGATVHCNSILLTGGLYRQSNISWGGEEASCDTGCATDGNRTFFLLNRLTYADSTWASTCTDDVNGYTADWTVVQGVIVELPDDVVMTLNPGIGTSHYFICY